MHQIGAFLIFSILFVLVLQKITAIADLAWGHRRVGRQDPKGMVRRNKKPPPHVALHQVGKYSHCQHAAVQHPQ
jgi:hypothetical protein